VADTPLCELDAEILASVFPGCQDDSEIVADLGCGSGRTAIPLAQKGYELLAVDLSEPMLNVLAEKSRELSLSDRIHLVRANLVELDCFADDSVDHAVCLFSTLGMVQGSASRLEMLRHVSRMVRPGGSFLLHVHNRWAALREPNGLRYLTSSWWRSLRQSDADFGDTTFAYRGLQEMFMHRFSRRELVRSLQRSKWQVETIWPLSIDSARIDRKTLIPGGFLVHCLRK
jgi:ubiquinone/menaquinone biosynthesis C-methylase UbiE